VLGDLIARTRRGHGGTVIVRGDPGIGKTALLDEVVAAAGVRTLRATGFESEADLPFAALGDLLRPILSSLDDVPPLQADALRGALGLGSTTAVDPVSVEVATASLLRAAAAEGVDHVGVGHEDLDVTNTDSVMAGMARYRPTIVINTAAFHRVDRCEDHPHEAYLVNAVGALLVARAAVHAGARSVYISTDYVFSGDKPPAEDGRLTPKTAWVEDDPVRPVNVYGASKAAGEQAARVADPRHLIARVSSLFGVAPPRNKGDNFIEAILKKARAGGPLRVVSDQWITPTYTVDAARAIVRLALSGAGGVAPRTLRTRRGRRRSRGGRRYGSCR